MAVYKEKGKNTWRVIYRYTDWCGENKQTQKRGFATKKEALSWEREQLNMTRANLDMTFGSFVDTYTADMKNRIKENTWQMKEHIIRTKMLPYFKNRKMCDILPKDVIAWQNKMLEGKTKANKPYSPRYLKTIHNQLSAIFNHAVKFYGLKENPAAKVGNMGKATGSEMLFWTQDEYKKFSDVMMDKPLSFYALKCFTGAVFVKESCWLLPRLILIVKKAQFLSQSHISELRGVMLSLIQRRPRATG